MAETLLIQFRNNALRLGNKSCFHYKKNNVWEILSWVDCEERVRRLSLGLASLGVKAQDKVALLSQTRMEWTLIDLAILANRAVTVPIYPTLSPDQIAYILEDAQISLLVVENEHLLGKLYPLIKGRSYPIVMIDGSSKEAIDLKKLLESGKKLPVNLYDETLKTIRPTDVASIIYTSGTTGQPKGAILTHRNFIAEVEALQEVFHFQKTEIGMMCLPLAHVIARAMQFLQLAVGCQAAYAESLDLLGANLREIRPHFMAGVPRLFEKAQARILKKIQESPRLIQKLFFWGLSLGEKRSNLLQKKMPIPWWLELRYKIATLLILKKVRKGLGGRLSCLISGGAPLSKEQAQFFHALGVLVIEGYGLTETFAAVTLNRLDDFRFGTIGKPLEAVRVKIAPDGEICVKGDMVFSGYLGLKQETEAAFDAEGWFLTGDIGEFTKDGFLKITDRKKDIIITSTGKNIAPQSIESLLSQSRYIQQAFVYGDQKKFLSALITLNWDVIEHYAKKNQISFHSNEELSKQPKIIELIGKEIEQYNEKLSNFERVKKFAILENNFSVESGELTPTMKIKRKNVAEKYRHVLNQLYE